MELRTCTSFFGQQRALPKERFVVRPSAYALIVHKDAILLITNETSGRFYVPGGGLEVGESLHEAVVREVQEEAGIAIEVIRLLAAEEDFFYYDPTDTPYHGLLFYYQALPLTVTLPTDYAGTEGKDIHTGYHSTPSNHITSIRTVTDSTD